MSFYNNDTVTDDNSIFKSNLKNKQKFFNVAHFNAQSLYPGSKRSDKFDDVRKMFAGGYLDIVGVSETWLKSYHTNSLVSLDDFKFYRNDRIGRRAGGVGMYVSKKLKAKVIAESEPNSTIEYLLIEVSTNNNKIAVGVIYRPEGDITDLNYLFSDIAARYRNVVFMGDFNLNLLDDNIMNRMSSLVHSFDFFLIIVIL